MKTKFTITFSGSLLTLIFIAPPLAQTSPYTSAYTSYTRTTTISAGGSDESVSKPGMTATAAGSTSDSWRQSASEAVRNAEVATRKAYDELARNVQNVSLEARIMAVLHENKATRDSEVQVTADNGIVTLTGQVPSAESAQQVQDIVAGIYGVKSVNSHLNYPGAQRGLSHPPMRIQWASRISHTVTLPRPKRLRLIDSSIGSNWRNSLNRRIDHG